MLCVPLELNAIPVGLVAVLVVGVASAPKSQLNVRPVGSPSKLKSTASPSHLGAVLLKLTSGAGEFSTVRFCVAVELQALFETVSVISWVPLLSKLMFCGFSAVDPDEDAFAPKSQV